LKVEEEKVQDKIRKLGELKSIAAMNEAQKKMADITDKYNIDGAMSTFDNAAKQVQEEADRLSAYDKIAVSEGEDLDKQLDQLTGKVKVDAALEDLKRKMGLSKEPAPVQQPEPQKISSAFDTEKEK